MFNWLCSFVLTCMVSFFMNTFGPLGNVFLIAFVIIMVAGAAIQITLELTPPFFHYGYGLPLYNAISGARHLLFGSHSRFALNVGVLLIFAAFFNISTLCVLLIRSMIRRRRSAKEKENATKSKAMQTIGQK